MRKILTYSILILVSLTIINILLSKYTIRWDLTSDKRYTLSQSTKELIDQIDENLVVKVYLKGDFPLDFKRLQQETEQHLEELKALNKNIRFLFINPEGKEEKIIKKGLQATRLTVEENGVVSERIIIPWAVINYKNKTANVSLLDESANNQDQQLQQSIENLEYAFSEAITNLIRKDRKTIAVLRGNNELEDIYLYDFLSALKEKYNLAPFRLSKENESSPQILEDLKKYDLAIIAKPTKAFSENEKFVLDQFITHGGKTLWFIDTVVAEMDSLSQNGEALFTPRDLNLTDLLFSYGVRINYNLIEDLYCSKIAVATGNIGSKPQFQQFLWRYYPLVTPNENHPISKSVGRVNLKFPTTIDTLKNGVKKEILLQSSPLTKTTGLPNIVGLASIAEKINPDSYNSGNKILGVLLEGEIPSAYQHRTHSFNTDYKSKSSFNKMIVISDGDFVANQIQNGKPTSLEVDKWTGQFFSNKKLAVNAVNYLLDDNNVIGLRSKTLDIKLLNKEKIYKERGFWQLINIVVPLLILFLFGLIYSLIRKRKYR